MKMNWLELERRIRAELRNAKQAKTPEQLAISLQKISTHVGDMTERGYELELGDLFADPIK